MPASPEPHDEPPFLPEGWLERVDGSDPVHDPGADAAHGEDASVGAPVGPPVGAPGAAGDGADRTPPASVLVDRLRRSRAHARALRSLPRVDAPAELDGLVVAALHGGHREDRAARYVATLGTLPAPASLLPRVERQVASNPALVAPAALDRLVEVRVLAESAGGNAAGGRRALAASAHADRQRRLSGLMTATAAGAVLGMLLGVVGVMWSLGGGWGSPGDGRSGDGAASAASASFVEFIEVDARDLTPAERALLSRLGGPLMGGRS